MTRKRTLTKRKTSRKRPAFIIEGKVAGYLGIIVGLGVLAATATWAQTSDSVTFSQEITSAIEVLDPNGGEDWAVDSVQNITWASPGTLTNVQIELQRSVGGPWEDIIASTSDDGSYPWTVTAPATTNAKVRISQVTDDSIIDQSDAVFTIGGSSGITEG